MASTTPRRPPQWVVDRLESLNAILTAPGVALKVWEQLLSSDEKRKLGYRRNDLYWKLGGTFGIWQKVHSLPTRQLAIVDLADRYFGLVPDEKRRLLAAIGAMDHDAQPRDVPLKPNWNQQRGELKWNGQRIRNVRLNSQPSQVQRLLDAFERQSWPDKIADPLFGGNDQQRLHQVVFSLNRGLDVIRFHVHEGGKAVSWSIAATKASKPRRSSRRQTARRAASHRRG